MADDDLYTEPLDIRTIDEAVVILGPGTISGAFTADAAEQSGLQLLQAAMRVRSWVNPALVRPASDH